MQDEFTNRLTGFTTSLDTLFLEENKPVWQGQAPEIFEEKVEEAKIMIEEIQTAQKDQEAGIEGAAEEKEREEDELEDAAYVLAQALVLYFRDHQQEAEAGALDLTPSDWDGLRDQQLLTKSQLVIEQAQALIAGADAVTAAKYGINAAAVAALTKERGDFDEIINAPAVAIAIRKALTKGFRPAFKLAEKKFKDLDKLILQFRGTSLGKALIAAWKNARQVKDAGHGPGTPATPTPPPTPV